ncbi:alpha/beta hydrolase-fold protein [Catenuloplanes indicus JCM 9534]|uniref:Pimeloyl-ACP methyl ester carboxylesterase n=1 Tax=Catenuloplanes indicus TaxID=137267 RepID=A0AAE3W8R5_9ACTN|nr:alpha/beta hydrolase-fold protein [Catenuloplanes indicus]MDQ0371322.1 pimeloyl-ACP methyl ester carboxylesterase [Catenuloplanes indicus]
MRAPAPAGVERLERVWSAARGREVDLYTAVPHGHGDGRGLPVCLVLHGGSKRPPDFAALGLGGFLTDAVRRGTPPFVLAGATGDRLAWQPSPADDPQRMAAEEIPAWCAARGFDPSRLAAWGWSMGGFGALLLAEARPGLLRAVAAFSPAVTPADPVFAGLTRLGDTPVGLWCGTGDPLYPQVRTLHDALPTPPATGGYTLGRHNFTYWSTLLSSAFSFIGASLRPSPPA